MRDACLLAPLIAALALPVSAAAPRPRPSPTMPPGAQAMSGTFHPGAAVQRAVEAWNAADLAYFESAFDADVVVVTARGPAHGREAALDAMAAPLDLRLRVEATRVVTGARGDAAWATWRWTGESGRDDLRTGAGTALFVKEEGIWRIVLVNLTADEPWP